jgi:hypothetical protein
MKMIFLDPLIQIVVVLLTLLVLLLLPRSIKMIYNGLKEFLMVSLVGARSNNNNNNNNITQVIWGLIYFVLCLALMITYVYVFGVH